MSAYYPMFLKISGWGCVVVGGGNVALERAQRLHAGGARIVVVAPRINAGFDRLDGIEKRPREFVGSDLEGAFLAVAATNNSSVNEDVAACSERRGILCNVVDNPERSQFVVPALVGRGPMQIAISTSGASPAFAARVRGQLDQWLPEDVEAYVTFLHEARIQARDAIADATSRQRVARFLASVQGYGRFQSLGKDARKQWLDGVIENPDAIEDES